MNGEAVSGPGRRQWLGYWSMIVQQTQNAFNDKMAQFILIPLGGAVGMSVESVAGLLISLPFVLFAPLAGWLSDRFSKRTVLFFSALLQLVVLFWICWALWSGDLSEALVGFFMLAVQAAFFSPAKMGLNKELLGSRHIGFATGIQQMLAMLAMLVGQIVAGRLFDDRFHAAGATPSAAWGAALGPMWVLAWCSVPTLLLAFILPPVPAQSREPFKVKLLLGHFHSLSDLWSDKPLRWASFGVAFFWGFAAYLNLWSVKLAKVLTHGGDGFGSLSSLFMAAASLGMAAGFGFASWLLRRGVNLGWVPLAGLLMALLSLVLAVMPIGGRHEFLAFVTFNPASLWSAASAAPGSAGFLLALGLLAFVSALYLAPLNAWMQDRYPAARRGELQSAVNLQDCFAGIAGVVIISLLEWGAAAAGMDPLAALRPHMLLVAALCLTASLLIIRLLPGEFLRFLFHSLIRATYRLEVVHSERIPAVGGVLLLPNHVTFADSFFISAASRRPVRFVMDAGFTDNRMIRAFTALFDTVNIRRDQPLEAIRTVIDGLKRGEVLCLFPEGQLTRTGGLCPLQRGFELIARKAGHPLVPLWVDGSWGSIFSFEGGRYFRKWPKREARHIIFSHGEVLAPARADLRTVRRAMMEASAVAVGARFAAPCWRTQVPSGQGGWRDGFAAADPARRMAFWANGHQVGMVHAIPRREDWFALRGDPCVSQLSGLFGAFPSLFGSRLILLDAFDGGQAGVWAGGAMLREQVLRTQVTARIVFHDFSGDARVLLEVEALLHCPALAVDGMVVSMSMPDPPCDSDDFPPQKGRKKGSWGRLLPGWLPDGVEDVNRVTGPAAPDGLELPCSLRVDDECFLVAR